MNALSSVDRSKLVGICGMLASDFAGERASAALLATRLLKERGLTWDAVIAAPAAIKQDDTLPWQRDLALCERHDHELTDWEYQFVESILARNRASPKQRGVLAEIAHKLRRRGFV